MGEVVGAGLTAHVPTIVLPEEIRRELNNGEDTTLVAGLQQLRKEVFETLDYDTVVVLDSHWATTVEFVVTAQERRKGLFTSEELPRGMSQRPYDFLGDPELAQLIASKADDHGTWITAISDDHLPIFYATTNLWEFLGQGLPDKRWISIGVCQTADTEDNLRLGRALGDAIAESDRKVVLLASGALSHTFWPLRELRKHEAAEVDHIFTPEAAAADAERMQWFEAGDHARVLDTMPEFYRFRPEARFGHYLMMIGAIGEGDCTATGRRYGEYENSIGTGQVHYWFDRPEGGFPTATPYARRPRSPATGGRSRSACSRLSQPSYPRSADASPRNAPDPAGRQHRGCRASRRRAGRRRWPNCWHRRGCSSGAGGAVQDHLCASELLLQGGGDDGDPAAGTDLLSQARVGAQCARVSGCETSRL